MRTWFAYNAIDSRDMGLYIKSLPDIVRPAERIEYKEIPGRSGSLRFLQGDGVYDGYVKTVTVYHKREEELAPVLQWLRGGGQLIFSNESDRAYDADLAAEVRFTVVDNDWEQADLQFWVQPYKSQYPPEQTVSLDDSLTVYNPGNTPAHPLIVIPALNSVAGNLIVNGTVYSITIGNVTIDCAAEVIYNTEGLRMDAMDLVDGFPVLSVGSNTVSAQGFADSIAITPRWRWI